MQVCNGLRNAKCQHIEPYRTYQIDQDAINSINSFSITYIVRVYRMIIVKYKPVFYLLGIAPDIVPLYALLKI